MSSAKNRLVGFCVSSSFSFQVPCTDESELIIIINSILWKQEGNYLVNDRHGNNDSAGKTYAPVTPQILKIYKTDYTQGVYLPRKV